MVCVRSTPGATLSEGVAGGGVEDGNHLKAFEYRKRIEVDTLKSALKERRKKKINKLLQVLRIKRFFSFFKKKGENKSKERQLSDGERQENKCS